MSSPKTIFIAAGGTGGHVFPAKRVAQKFLKEGFKVIWIGTNRGPEKNICKELDISFIQVPLNGFRGKSLLIKLKALIAFLISGVIFLSKSNLLNRENYPMIVFGGYVSLIAFFYFKGPVFLQEQNTIPGSVSKLLFSTNKVSKVFCGFPKTKQIFENFDKKYIKLIESGNPIGEVTLRNNTKNHSDKFNLLVLGGSQGSSFLNEHVPKSIEIFLKNSQINVLHQCGANKKEYVEKSYDLSSKNIQIEEFINHISQSYTWADLVICRSGALTISELVSSKSVGILVPLKNSIDNHQMENASYLHEKNASWILQESEEFSLNLFNLLKDILEKKEIVDEKKVNLEKIKIKPSEQIIFKEVNAWYE